MHKGRPVPLHRQVEDVIIDIRAWERQVRADNRLDRQEVRRGLSLMSQLVALSGTLAVTMGHIATCAGGSDGVYSPRAISGWAEAHRHPVAAALLRIGDEQDAA